MLGLIRRDFLGAAEFAAGGGWGQRLYFFGSERVLSLIAESLERAKWGQRLKPLEEVLLAAVAAQRRADLILLGVSAPVAGKMLQLIRKSFFVEAESVAAVQWGQRWEKVQPCLDNHGFQLLP